MLAEYVSPAGRRARADEEGLSLVEIMIAAFILSVAILGLASVAASSLVSVRDSRERDRATAAASSALEAARSLAFEEIALGGTAWQADLAVTSVGGVWRLDHNDDGSFTEDIVASAGGHIDPYACTSDSACWFDMPAGTRVEVRTFVSKYEDVPVGFARRVTVIAIWDDPSFAEPRVVRMTTVVSHADRGLPAPSFDVWPESRYTRVDQFFVNIGPPDGWYCFQHVITNSGVPDRYEIHLPVEDGWAKVPPEVGGVDLGDVEGQFYNTNAAKPWRFRAYLVPNGEEMGSDTIMQEVPGATPQRVLSQGTLDTEETADLFMCYVARQHLPSHIPPPSTGNEYYFVHTIHSAFDPEIYEVVEHTIEVAALQRLYLHYGHYVVMNPEDPDEDWIFDWEEHLHQHEGEDVYTRPARDRTSDGAFVFDRHPMLPTQPPAVSMPEYDRYIHFDESVHPHSPTRLLRPGMYLPRGSITIDGATHERQALGLEWEWQFNDESAPVTFSESATLRLWARRVPPGQEDPSTLTPHQWCLKAELFRVDSGGSPVLIGEGDQTQDPVTGAWALVEIQIEYIDDTVSFAPNDYLRLRVNNAGADLSPNCTRLNVGFGTLERDASLDFESAE